MRLSVSGYFINDKRRIGMHILKSSNGMKFLDILTYPEIKIFPNAVTFIVGKSGCGKSTYLKLLNATILPSVGSIEYNGKNIQELDIIDFRKKVMLVPQEVFLFDETIEENFALYCRNREEEKPLPAQMENALDICCANFPLSTRCSVLSGGEKQRVFLAIFLSCLPEVLLLDEPTAALDINTAQTLLANIKCFCNERNITAIVVCHTDELVKAFADYTIQLGGKS